MDVNHGGSSGFGRAYRERLNGNWGVVDVGDVVAGVKYLIDTGRVDGNRAAIRGGSAGGFTVLAAVSFSRRVQGGSQLLWSERPRGTCARYAQIRVALPGPAGCSVARRTGDVRGASADPAPGKLQGRAHYIPGVGGQGGSSRPIPRHCRGPRKRREYRLPTSNSRGNNTGFVKRRTSCARSSRSWRFMAGCLGSSRTARCRRCRCSSSHSSFSYSTGEAPCAPNSTTRNSPPTRSSVVREPCIGWQQTTRPSEVAQLTTALMIMKCDTTIES